MGARLHILSDLHAKFGAHPLRPAGTDIVVLAGDIGVRLMTDCRRIRRSPQFRRFNGRDMAHFHRLSREWLTARLAEPFDGPTIVVTHHAPSARSLSPDYPTDILSACYASDLDALVESSGAALWVHGHTHRCADYTIGKTRVISNPRGYPGDTPSGFVSDLVVTVG